MTTRIAPASIGLLAGLVAAVALALFGAPAAAAAPDVSAAAAALRGGETVFVDPAAENALSAQEASEFGYGPCGACKDI